MAHNPDKNGLGVPTALLSSEIFVHEAVCDSGLPLIVRITPRKRACVCGSGVESVLSGTKSLGREVGVPSLRPRPGGVLQPHGLGVLRPSGGANAVAGCWPT